MTNEATLKTGDTGRVLEATLRYGNGDPIDLTGCTVEFRWRPANSTYATLTKDAAVTDAAAGVVRVGSWQAADLDEPGSYAVEFVITDTDDQELTVPSDGYLLVRLVTGIEPGP